MAKSLDVDLEEFVEGVVFHVLHPDAPPKVVPIPPEALKEAGIDLPATEAEFNEIVEREIAASIESANQPPIPLSSAET